MRLNDKYNELESRSVNQPPLTPLLWKEGKKNSPLPKSRSGQVLTRTGNSPLITSPTLVWRGGVDSNPKDEKTGCVKIINDYVAVEACFELLRSPDAYRSSIMRKSLSDIPINLHSLVIARNEAISNLRAAAKIITNEIKVPRLPRHPSADGFLAKTMTSPLSNSLSVNQPPLSPLLSKEGRKNHVAVRTCPDAVVLNLAVSLNPDSHSTQKSLLKN